MRDFNIDIFVKKLNEIVIQLNSGDIDSFNLIDSIDIIPLLNIEGWSRPSKTKITDLSKNKENPYKYIWTFFTMKRSVIAFRYSLLLDNKGIFSYSVCNDFIKNVKNNMEFVNFKYIGRKNPTISNLIQKNYNQFDLIFKTNLLHKIINNKFLFDIKSKFDNIESNTKRKNVDLFQFYQLKSSISLNKMIKIDPLDISSAIYNCDYIKLYKFASILIKENSIENIINNLNFEDISDLIAARTQRHEYDLILSQKLTKKDKTIVNEDAMNLILELTLDGLSATDFHNEFLKKISKYKTEEEFYTNLKKYCDQKSGWKKWSILDNITKINATYNEIDDNILIVSIKDFKTSSYLGSASWCISSDEFFFKNYTENYQRQFFLYDFNKKSNDPLSFIGVTVNHLGEIIYAHDKNDSCIINKTKQLSELFKPLNDDDLFLLIDELDVSKAYKIADCYKYRLQNTNAYNKLFSDSLDIIRENDPHTNVTFLNIASKEMAWHEFNNLLCEIDANIDGDFLSLESALEFFPNNTTPFIYNFYLTRIHKTNLDDNFFEHFFSKNNVHTLTSNKEYGSLNLIIEVLKTKKNNSKISHNTINILSNKEIYDYIVQYPELFSRINTPELSIAVLRSDLNTNDFKQSIIDSLDDSTSHIIVKQLFLSLDAPNLNLFDLNKLYPDGIFKAYQDDGFSKFLELWLEACRGDSCESVFYQHLFKYLKEEGMKIFDLINYDYIANESKLRQVMVEKNLIDDKLYFKSLMRSASRNKIFMDNNMVTNTFNNIAKIYEKRIEKDSPIHNQVFLIISHMIDNDFIEALQIKQFFGDNFYNISLELKSKIYNLISYNL